MPSGIMTMSAVPMRRPVPIAEIRRIWRWEREKDRGRDPAKNELVKLLAVLIFHRRDNCLRQSHYAAQDEQHS